MPYVITPGCCSDASCVSVCPVNCIHPSPGEADFGSTSTLFVDPATCIDCGACADACPVDAIGPADLLLGRADEVSIGRNADFFRGRPPAGPATPSFPMTLPATVADLRVAVIGTGPAAQYTADLLLRVAGAEVTMFDRVATSGGLLRYGVAPDHPDTRKLADRFAGFRHNPRLHVVLGVEIGSDVTADELAAHFHAVVYAVGASAGKDLGIPGEQLPGSVSATRVVAWYNGHPDAVDLPVGLTSVERAVLVGNGNVALDVARILLADPEALVGTDIAGPALEALRRSAVREVVVVARRGPEHAAYTAGELHALGRLPGVDLVVADTPALRGSRAVPDLPVVAFDGTAAPPPGRRIVLMFGAVPRSIDGDSGGVRAVRFDTPGGEIEIEAGLIVRAIGYTGVPVPGLPFDPVSGRIPNDHGRVVDGPGLPRPGTFVVGWIKRGATGGIGANRQDAADTVRSLLEDAVAGRLSRPTRSGRRLRARLRRRVPSPAG